jgi:hypothetical protein
MTTSALVGTAHTINNDTITADRATHADFKNRAERRECNRMARVGVVRHSRLCWTRCSAAELTDKQGDRSGTQCETVDPIDATNDAAAPCECTVAGRIVRVRRRWRAQCRTAAVEVCSVEGGGVGVGVRAVLCSTRECDWCWS